MDPMGSGNSSLNGCFSSPNQIIMCFFNDEHNLLQYIMIARLKVEATIQIKIDLCFHTIHACGVNVCLICI